jgi:hypothetical protein
MSYNVLLIFAAGAAAAKHRIESAQRLHPAAAGAADVTIACRRH